MHSFMAQGQPKKQPKFCSQKSAFTLRSKNNNSFYTKDEMPPRSYSRWVLCPQCGNRTKTKIYEDTVLLHFPLYCAHCKKETVIGVLKYNIVVSDEPDA